MFKVKLADLVRDGEVRMFSDDKICGAHIAYIGLKKGYEDTGNNCGVALFIREGPLPCRISFTIEIVHWDGRPESALERDHNLVWEFAGGLGWPNFISLSELTDANFSPYVYDGHVTFIVTFRILPVD